LHIYIYIYIDIYTDVQSRRVTKVPFGSHFGYLVEFNGAALVSVTEQYIPKPLPLEQFQVKLVNFSKEDLDLKLHDAKKKAKFVARIAVDQNIKKCNIQNTSVVVGDK